MPFVVLGIALRRKYVYDSLDFLPVLETEKCKGRRANTQNFVCQSQLQVADPTTTLIRWT